MKGNFLYLGIVLLMLTAFLQLGTVLKKSKDDPILKTQTDPILYKDKLEEMKDGEKGAPSPSFKLYGTRQLSDPPVEKEPIQAETYSDKLPEPGDPIPEDLSGIEEEDTSYEEDVDESWWVDEEEQAQDSDNSFKDSTDLDVVDR